MMAILIDRIRFFVVVCMIILIGCRVLELILRGIRAFIKALPERISPNKVVIKIGLTEERLPESHLLTENIFFNKLFGGLTDIINIFFVKMVLVNAIVGVLDGVLEIFNFQ